MPKFKDDKNVLGRVLAAAVLLGSGFFFLRLFGFPCCQTRSAPKAQEIVTPGENLRDAVSSAVKARKN